MHAGEKGVLKARDSISLPIQQLLCTSSNPGIVAHEELELIA